MAKEPPKIPDNFIFIGGPDAKEAASNDEEPEHPVADRVVDDGLRFVTIRKKGVPVVGHGVTE